MPEFKNSPSSGKTSNKSSGNTNSGGGLTIPDTRISEPRCHVCSHKQRKIIDRFLAKGTSYRELERVFAVDRRSISNHDKNHLNLNDAAIRSIIIQEASAANEDFEEGVRGVLKRRVYLETALEKALDAILNGDVTVEPKDAVSIIEKLDSLENQTSEAAVSQMRIELNAYIRAMKEVVPSEMWDRVFQRTRAIIDRDSGGETQTRQIDEG